jgi:RHS repeat-associated protein
VSYTFNLRYPGQWYDAESGLHSNGFRFYDPGKGRYVASDPIGLGGGPSTYSYASSNPFVRADPFGLSDFFTVAEHGTYSGEIGNQSFYVYPGDPVASPPKTTAAAITIVKFIVKAVCKDGGTKSSPYSEFVKFESVHVYFEIYKRSSLHSGYEDADEQQHVDHYLEWAEQDGRRIAHQAEEQAKQDVTGDCNTDCEANAAAYIQDKLAPTLGAKAAFTKAFYDETGLHDHEVIK